MSALVPLVVFAAAFVLAALSLADSARAFWMKAHELGLFGDAS